MICNGNKTEICGGPNRLNVYDYKEEWSDDQTSTSTTIIPPRYVQHCVTRLLVLRLY